MKDYNVTCNNKMELEAVHLTEINRRFYRSIFGGCEVILIRDSSAIAMQTSWLTGTRNLPLLTLVLPSHEAAGLSSMPDVLSVGPPSFNLKLHFPQLKPNTSHVHVPT